MKLTSSLATVILLGPLMLTGQSADKSQTPRLIIRVAPTVSGCPIGMQARHEFFFQRELINGSTQPQDQGTKTRKDQGMQINLTLTGPPPNRIVAAKVTVRGLNGKWQVLNADGTRNDSSESTKILDLEFAAGTTPSVSTDLRLPGFTTVSSIQLDSVTYADGSTWRFAAHDFCTVAPDPLMRIAGR